MEHHQSGEVKITISPLSECNSLTQNMGVPEIESLNDVNSKNALIQRIDGSSSNTERSDDNSNNDNKSDFERKVNIINHHPAGSNDGKKKRTVDHLPQMHTSAINTDSSDSITEKKEGKQRLSFVVKLHRFLVVVSILVGIGALLIMWAFGVLLRFIVSNEMTVAKSDKTFWRVVFLEDFTFEEILGITFAVIFLSVLGMGILRG
eukprot:Awhi_evm2s12547